LKNGLFLLLASVVILLAPMRSTGQTVNDEVALRAFTRSFMVAFNQQDHEALEAMFTDDALYMDAGGNEIRGAANIGNHFANQFLHDNATLALRPM